MKVCQVVNTLTSGGAEWHLLRLCRELQRYGVEPVVIALKERDRAGRSLRPDFEGAGIRVHDLHAYRPLDVRCLFKLVSLIRAERPALLHTHLPRADLAGALACALFPRLPLVCSVHGHYDAFWSGAWSLPLLDVVWRRADAVIAISGAVKQWLVGERSLPPEKVQVVYYGLDLEPFPGEGAHETGPAWNEARLVSIGRLEPGKGHDVLIRAMAAVRERVPNVTLSIAGADTWGYGATLENLIAELRLGACTRLVGFQRDVTGFLRDADAFVFASHSEGFGQVVIEAMAASKPVVARRIAPLTEIVADGETGILVEPDDPGAFAAAMVWMLTHRAEARHMGRRGRERVRREFSADRMGREMLALYAAVLGRELLRAARVSAAELDAGVA